MALALTSPAVAEGGVIPARYTCDGADRSPPLRWSGVPAAARSLVLLVDDADATGPGGDPWVHWMLYDLPAHAGGLGEGAPPPPGARTGRNDWGRTGYGGPCPPGGAHRYRFALFALDARLGDLGAPGASDLAAAMEGRVLATARLSAVYARGRPPHPAPSPSPPSADATRRGPGAV